MRTGRFDTPMSAYSNFNAEIVMDITEFMIIMFMIIIFTIIVFIIIVFMIIIFMIVKKIKAGRIVKS